MTNIEQLKPQKSFCLLSLCNISALDSHDDWSGNYRELMKMFKSCLHDVLMGCPVPDVINHAKFQLNRFSPIWLKIAISH